MNDFPDNIKKEYENLCTDILNLRIEESGYKIGEQVEYLNNKWNLSKFYLNYNLCLMCKIGETGSFVLVSEISRVENK